MAQPATSHDSDTKYDRNRQLMSNVWEAIKRALQQDALATPTRLQAARIAGSGELRAVQCKRSLEVRVGALRVADGGSSIVPTQLP